MKRATFLAVLFVVCVVATLATPTGRHGVALAQETKRPKIGVSIPAADHGWTAGIGWWAKRAMAITP